MYVGVGGGSVSVGVGGREVSVGVGGSKVSVGVGVLDGVNVIVGDNVGVTELVPVGVGVNVTVGGTVGVGVPVGVKVGKARVLEGVDDDGGGGQVAVGERNGMNVLVIVRVGVDDGTGDGRATVRVRVGVEVRRTGRTVVVGVGLVGRFVRVEVIVGSGRGVRLGKDGVGQIGPGTIIPPLPGVEVAVPEYRSRS